VGELYVFRGLQPIERKLIYISLVGIAFCLYLLQFYNFSNLNSAKLEREIGFVSESQSDIRIKNYAQSFWQAAQSQQKVREGDKIYTGEKSFAKINLKNESKIELKENSLVEFKKMKNMNIADLEEGEYRVAIVKNLKIAIKGQIANIEGESEIVLKVSKNKTISVETLQGTPKIQYQSKVYSPTKEAPSMIDIIAPLKNQKIQNTDLAEQLDSEEGAREPSNAENDASPAVAIQINADSKTFDYNVKMYDVYDRDGQQLKLKPQGRTLVRFAVPLEILTFDSTKEIFIEYSNNADLSESRQYAADALDRSLAQVFLGNNYWRASQNKQDWSSTGHFVVRAITLPSSEVKVSLNETSLYLKNGTAEVDLQLSTNIDANGYLVESSNTAVFDRKSTTHWSYENKLHLQFNRAGTYYYRFRAVDENLHLGAWSKITPIEVLELAPLKAPQFVRSEYITNSDENLLLSWSNPDHLEKFKIAITDAKDNTVFEKTISDPSFQWTPRNPGTYRAEIRSLDSRNRVSEPGLAAVIVKAAIIRLSKLTDSFKRGGKGDNAEDDDAEKKAKDKSRKTASKADEANDVEIRTQYPTIQLGYNADFVLSRLTFSTNYYDIVYSPVLSASSELPVATPGLQVAALAWRGHHGGELMVQKNLSSNEPGAADFYSAEARYHYRFYDNKDRADVVGFHLSPYIGYELYSNSNSLFFVSKYNMAKLGLFFELPIMQSWTMGLTAAYGTGDSLTKYEGLFDVSYFFKKQWTMGVGLKSSVMFGTTSQFPIYPDYREGYSLGQFNLRYFF
jgi:hypothetical protein